VRVILDLHAVVLERPAGWSAGATPGPNGAPELQSFLGGSEPHGDGQSMIFMRVVLRGGAICKGRRVPTMTRRIQTEFSHTHSACTAHSCLSGRLGLCTRGLGRLGPVAFHQDRVWVGGMAECTHVRGARGLGTRIRGHATDPVTELHEALTMASSLPMDCGANVGDQPSLSLGKTRSDALGAVRCRSRGSWSGASRPLTGCTDRSSIM
jgi:hypothetical protein